MRTRQERSWSWSALRAVWIGAVAVVLGLVAMAAATGPVRDPGLRDPGLAAPGLPEGSLAAASSPGGLAALTAEAAALRAEVAAERARLDALHQARDALLAELRALRVAVAAEGRGREGRRGAVPVTGPAILAEPLAAPPPGAGPDLTGMPERAADPAAEAMAGGPGATGPREGDREGGPASDPTGGPDADAESLPLPPPFQRPPPRPLEMGEGGAFRVFVHHRAGSEAAASVAEATASRVREAGFEVAGTRPVPAVPAARVVRYFHASDAQGAVKLAGRLGYGWAIQDFRAFSPPPTPQTLEIWLPER